MSGQETRIKRRPIAPVPPASTYGVVSYSQVALEGGVLCVECRSCNKRTALTKHDCPQIRTANGRYVLHATFKCLACGADKPYEATQDEAKMFWAGDPLQRQIGR
jgi:hypothetical protein